MCSIDYADGYSTYLQDIHRKARKPHKCGECYRAINKGEVYLYEVVVFDEQVSSHKTCLHCEIARKWLEQNCSGFVWGEVEEDLAEHCDTGMPIEIFKYTVGMRRQWTTIKGELMKLPRVSQ